MQSTGPVVRFFYISPSDRALRPEYTEAIKNAALDVQQWYAEQLGNGKSFALADPIVEVVESQENADFFGAMMWGRAIEAAKARFYDSNEKFIIYVDATRLCDSPGVGGNDGIAVWATMICMD